MSHQFSGLIKLKYHILRRQHFSIYFKTIIEVDFNMSLIKRLLDIVYHCLINAEIIDVHALYEKGKQ